MSLPVDNLAWPPSTVRKSYSHVAEWAAWWTGDPNELGSFYNGGSENGLIEDSGRRPFMFWSRRGKKATESVSMTKLHVPVAGDLASFSADLLFAEEPSFTNPDAQDSESDAGIDRLNEILSTGGLWNLFLEAAETAAALGGLFLRPVWDKDVVDVPFLSVIHPDNAVPEWSWGRLTAVTFWEILNPEEVKSDSDKVLRHLERHEVRNGEALIIHGLYKGTKTKLGSVVDLGSHERTAGLVTPSSRMNGSFLEIPIPKLGRLDVEYVPNMRPNRRDRGSAEGRSDFEGLEGLFDALDEVWTSWMRDIRLGQSRIVVPGEFLEKKGRGSGSGFDVDSEVFTPLEMDPSLQEKAGITVVQFALRTAQHLETALALLERIVDGAGYAPQSFGLGIEGRAESGTALKVRERKSFTTQSKKRRYWGSPLENVLETLLIIDKEVFGSKVKPFRPTVVWPEASRPDMAELSQTLDALKRALSVSTETRVALLHPDWDRETIDAEVERIRSEEGLSVEPPEMVGGIDIPPPAVSGFDNNQEDVAGTPAEEGVNIDEN